MTTKATSIITIIAGLALLLATIVGASAASGSEQTAMRFERLSIDDGLSQSSVMAIAQDRTGFMWFATENGLDRYDGFTFRNYRRQRRGAQSLSSNFARDMDFADDGSLWIATDGGGVSRWMPATDSFVTWSHDPLDMSTLASDNVRTILTDPRGYVWIGTRDAGLDRLDVTTGSIIHYAHAPDAENTISDNDIHALALTDGGILWIGTRAGLNRLDNDSGQIRHYRASAENTAGLEDDWVRSLLIDHEGTLWVGTNAGGLARFDAETETFRHFRHAPDDFNGLSSDRIETLFEDDARRLWIGTDSGLSLLHRATGEFVSYRHDPADPTSLSGNSVFSIFQDRGGILWVGTQTEGLNKWNPRSWSFGHYSPSGSRDGSLSNPNITSFTEDRSGRLWVGTFGGGLNIMDRRNDTVTQLRHDPEAAVELSDDRVMTLLTDREGNVWAGTMRGGLNHIDASTGAIRTFRHDPTDDASLAANGVMSLLQDRAGALWVGTFGGGVSRLDPQAEHFVNYRHDPADATTLSHPRATSIAEDSSGAIWVGTDGGGLNRLDRDSGEWQRFAHDANDPDSLNADSIYALHVDAADTLWIGTRAGLNRHTSAGFSTAAARLGDAKAIEAVTSNAVYSIESDLSGDLWLGTARGLTRYGPQNGSVRSFHESQGLQGEEFNFGASYAGGDGKLYFGGSNGFNAFNPAELDFNSEPPSVALTALAVLNKPVAADRPYELIDSIELAYSDDVVTFGISALDFSAPEENRYSYKLDGFDEDWVDAGTERRITYTNLDGGNYVLRVRAANGDGYWNNEGLSIPLTVAHPPWQTWWAYTLYAAAILFVTLGFVRRQQQKLQREAEYSRRLEQEVMERTNELNRKNVDLEEANAKLTQASTTDPLTGLPNRRYLYEQIGKDVDLVLRHYRDGTETMKPGGNNDLLFLMVDLDHFKPVNDSCGHEAGDELLCQIRDVLLEACRFSDDVIRWGGDEFLIVARDTNRKYAATLAERVRSSLAQRVFPVGNGQVARTSASIGYASFPFIKEQPELLQWEEVLGVADAAMYEAKQKRNAWIGIEGIDWDGTSDELYSAIKLNPGKLAAEGLICAVESVDDAEQSVG